MTTAQRWRQFLLVEIMFALWLVIILLAGSAIGQPVKSLPTVEGPTPRAPRAWGRACDADELIAASRTWARVTELDRVAPDRARLLALPSDRRTVAQKLRDQADAIEAREEAEQRWRRAVAACAPSPD